MARARMRCGIGVLALALAAALAAVLAAAPASAGAPEVPLAGGDSAANIPLNEAGRAVLTRWVARRTGTVAALHLRVKVEGSAACPLGGRSGYAAGTTGRWRATTHPVLADGRPDLGRVLAAEELDPCARHQGESVRLALGLPVVAGQELATVVRNMDPRPAANWSSTNHLFIDTGVPGANGRNERDPAARDAHFGLDPRELVGYSTDGGATWALPGGPYGGAGGRAFLPTYVQEYADGAREGQPFYYALPASGSVTMVYPGAPAGWTIRALGAYTSSPGAATVRLTVDGVQRAAATLSGAGVLRAAIDPVAPPAGATVRVTTTAGAGGLGLEKLHADAVWAGVMRLGATRAWYMEGSPQNAVPLYPLPMHGAAVVPGPAPPPAAAPAPSPGAPARGRSPADRRAQPAPAPFPRTGPRVREVRPGRTWRVDLGRARIVRRVVLDWRRARPGGYRIGTSLDGRRFVTAARVAAGRPGARATRFAPRRARYLRITRTGSAGRPALRAVRILGAALDSR